ncbi:MAG: serine/threonine-protein phosphatase [Lachnospiraceae bacterium]|nr:serine/threonine-protein phosphatase [Lachnospiraceae bacterium]
MKKTGKTIISTSMLVLFFVNIVLIIAFMIHRGIDELPYYSIINLTFDLCGLGVSFFLAASVFTDDTSFTKNTKYFMALAFIVSLNIFWDACCWLVDGLPQYVGFNYFNNLVYYLIGYVYAAVFWGYVRFALNRNDAFAVKVSRYCSFFFVFTVVFTVINPLHNLLFYVSEDGYYHRAPAFFLCYIFPVIMNLLSGYLIVVSKVTLRKKIALISFLLFPAIGFGVSSLFYGISVGYPTIMCSIILLYGSLYSEKGYANAIENVEHDYAIDVQTSILKKEFPNEEHFSLYGNIYTSPPVTGDFYDFVRMDNEHIIFGVGSTSGKGMPASIFMMKALLILRASSASRNISEAITAANNLICEKNGTSMYVNAWLGVINIRTGQMHYINAGSKPPVLIRDRQASYIKSPPNNPLGVRPGIEYTERTVELKRGDIILAYTDGLADVICGSGDTYNESKLLSILNISNDSAKKTCKTVEEEIGKYLEKNEAVKDMTTLAFKYHG